MVRGLGMTCTKNLIFALNLVFVLCGIALITVGGLMLKVLSDHGEVVTTGSYVGVPAILLIILGGAVFVLAFLACCGAISESPSMLNVYSALMFLILVGEIILACAVVFYKDEAERQFQNALDVAFRQYNSPDQSMKKAWDFLQLKMECCGLTRGSADFGNMPSGIPPSCCGRTSGACDAIHAYPTGCVPKIREFINNNVKAVAATAGVVALIEIILIILSCCLASDIRSQ